MASLQYAKESILLKVLQDVADDDKRTQTLELMSSSVWKGKSAALTASLADALLMNTKVTALNMSDCNIGDQGLISLSDSIKDNTTVRAAPRVNAPHPHRRRDLTRARARETRSSSSATSRTTSLPAPA